MTYKEHEKAVTVAAVNWKGEWGNKAANLEKIKIKVREARLLGANMVCFPELALSGYECGEETKRDQRPCSMHMQAAETIPGPATEELAKLAKDLDIYVILGMPERDATDPREHYISIAVVGPEGILGKYRKIHLGGPPIWFETFCFKTGDELPVFETRYGTIGVLSCADVWCFPELSRILALKGARVIFNSTGSAAIPRNVDVMTHVTAARAMENIAYVVSANHVGKERTMSYYGHSTIAGIEVPECCRIFAQGGNDEEIVWATLNFEALEYARSICTLRRGKWKLIAKEFQRIAESEHWELQRK
jgi:predicted amidohydrolase